MTNQKIKVVEKKTTMLDWKKFHEDVQKILDAYFKQDYQRGLKLSLNLVEQYPQISSRTYFFVACLHSLLGEKEQALRSLEEGMAKGGWWTLRALQAEQDLKPLHNDQRFIELGRKGDQKLEELKKTTTPELRIQFPSSFEEKNSYDVLLALHWRGGNNDESLAFWNPLLEQRDDLILAFLQSSQPFADGEFCWDDWETTKKEVILAHEMLGKKFSIRRFILNGSSQGAAMAFKIAFRRILAVNRLILTMPAIKGKEHVVKLLENDDKTVIPCIPTAILVGKKDMFYQGALETIEFLKERKIPTMFHVWPDVGHAFPPDFIEKINAFLDAEI